MLNNIQQRLGFADLKFGCLNCNIESLWHTGASPRDFRKEPVHHLLVDNFIIGTEHIDIHTFFFRQIPIPILYRISRFRVLSMLLKPFLSANTSPLLDNKCVVRDLAVIQNLCDDDTSGISATFVKLKETDVYVIL